MPLHMADLTTQALAQAGRPIDQARVAVLGYAYLENSDDTRNSPSAVLVPRLRQLGAEVVVHDPWVADYRGDLLTCLRGSDAAVVMVAHRDYCDLSPDMLRETLRTPILVDGRGLFDPAAVRAAGVRYAGVGR
jgi:UDP-N-acetyl-D-mannosaminuronic acid dehydrogenase